MKIRNFAFALCLMASFGCGAKMTSASAPHSETREILDIEPAQEEDVASLSLAGLGDRFCKLEFSFVQKQKDGNFVNLGRGRTADSAPRTGVGLGCLDFCSAAMKELRAKNAAHGLDILLNSCTFAEGVTKPAPAAAPAPSPAAAPAAAPVAAPVAAPAPVEMRDCAVIQADLQVIHAKKSDRVACVQACAQFEATNPSRKCTFGQEVIREHPINACAIVGSGGKVHYSQNVTRFHCRMECKARETTNPQRSCVWGGINVRD